MTKIALVGEAYGEHEEREQTAFVGAAGFELTRMLSEAGIERADCFLTNVFNIRPPGNKVEAFCGPKAEGIKGFPALVKSKYVSERYIPELERLGDELVRENPNIIVALGNTPTWALLGKTGISKIRGTTFLSSHTAEGFKVLPTYHPAAILRQWDLRAVTIFDLIKASRESEFPEIRRPQRSIWIEPTIEDLHEFRKQHIDGCERLAVDIETSGSQVTCIGFCPAPHIALVLPFVDHRRKGKSYWSSTALEHQAWLFVRGLLEDRTIRKVFQNGLYDIAFLYRAQNIRVYGAEHDTMLLHHALQPESLKSLGFLGSVYTDEGAWKQERKVTTIKRDE